MPSSHRALAFQKRLGSWPSVTKIIIIIFVTIKSIFSRHQIKKEGR